MLVALMLLTTVAADARVTHAVTPQRISVSTDSFFAEWDRRSGALRMLRDGDGAVLDVPPVTSAVLDMFLPPVRDDRHRIDFAQRQAAVLRIYPGGDGDAAIEHPALAWGVPLAEPMDAIVDGDAVVLRAKSRAGDTVTQRIDAAGLHVRVDGNRGPYSAILLLPVPDEAGHLDVEGTPLFLQGFAGEELETHSFQFLSPYQNRAASISLDGRARVAFTMQHRGTAPERAVIPHSKTPFLAVKLPLPLHIALPPAGDARLLSQRVTALRTRTLGIPDGPALHHVEASRIALASGEPLELKGLPSGNVSVQAMRLEKSDPMFAWRQIQPEHYLPGFQPFPSSLAWQTLRVKRDGDVVRCSLPDGIHRVRVGLETGAYGELLVVVGEPKARAAMFVTTGRSVFMQGERIPIAVVAGSGGSFAIQQGLGMFSAGTIPPSTAGVQHLALDTSRLRAGEYTLFFHPFDKRARTAQLQWKLVLPEQPSRFVLEDNQLNPAPFDWDLPPGPFGGVKPVASEHNFAEPFASLGITAMRRTLASVERYAPNRPLQNLLQFHGNSRAPEEFPAYSLQRPWMDSLTEHRIGYWQGVPSRGLSFTKARTIREHVDGMAQLLAIQAQRLRGFPSFGGLNVDVDTARTHPDTALEHTNVQGDVLKRVRGLFWDAQMAEFKRFQSRVPEQPYHVQWSHYLAELFPVTNAGLQNLLKSIDAGFKQTSNTEYNHAPTNHGAYPPTLYQGLDFTSLEAWADMRFHTLQDAYWTALADAGRKVHRDVGAHPLWVQAQAIKDAFADHLERNWFEALAFGAEGTGFAANIHGLNMYDVQAHVADANRDRAKHLATILKQLGPWFSHLPRERDVAILHSFHQGAHPDSKVYAGEFSNPIFTAFFCLTWAQFTPDIVFEESILDGALAHYRVLVVAGQMQPLPADVLARLKEFQARGGVIVTDSSTTLGIPGARRMDAVDFSRIRPDSPTLWYAWERYLRVASALRSTLEAIAPRPAFTDGEEAILSVSRAGDARVLLALNNHYVRANELMPVLPGKRSVDWLDFQRLEPHSTRIHLRDDVKHAFDLLRQKEVPVQRDAAGAHIVVDFSAGNLGWFLLTDDEIDVPALQWRVQDGAPTHARVTTSLPLPVELALMDPGGTVAHQWFGASGEPFSMERAWNDRDGRWTVTARELVTGRRSTAHFDVKASNAPPPVVIEPRGNVLMHDAAAIRTRLSPGQAVTILVDNAQPGVLPHAEHLRDLLRAHDVKVDLWTNPAIVEEPVDWLYRPEDAPIKAAIERGEVIGERFWRGGDLLASWKSSGTRIERHLVVMGTPANNRWLAELAELRVLPETFSPNVPGPGNALIAHVWAPFSAHHHVIALIASDDAGLQRGIEELTTRAPSVDIPSSISSVRARLLGTMGFASPTAPEDGWASAPAIDDVHPAPIAPLLGTAVHSVMASPDGEFVAASVDSHGYNVFLLNKAGRILWRRRVGAASLPVVRGVSNSGTVAIDLGDFSEFLDVKGERIRQDAARRVQWLSPDGSEAIFFHEKQLMRIALRNDAVKWQRAHHIPPSAQGHIMELVPSPDGKMILGPSWEPMAAPNGNVPPDMRDVFFSSWDITSGAVLWTLPETHAVGVRFSANAQCIGLARKRFTPHPRIPDAIRQSPNHDALLTLVDNRGATIIDIRADAPLLAVLPSENCESALGIPFLTHPWVLLAQQDGRATRRPQPGVVDGAVLGEDRVLLAHVDGELAEMDLRTGSGWTAQAGRQARVWPAAWGAIAGTVHGELVALSSDGKVLWRRPLTPLTSLTASYP